jgi:nucleoside-diphosphate-sugar epimerase
VRVVVTGGAGFVGSHLVDRYLRDGHEVVAVDNLCTGSLENLDAARIDERFSLVSADVGSSIPVEGKVDLVLRFASPASPDDYTRLACETLAVNSRGTEHACELAGRHGARLVFASTSEVYGDPLVHPQAESYWGNVNPVGPRSCYEEAKRFAEAAIATRMRLSGLDARIARIFNTYGPRMQAGDGRVVPTFLARALAGEPLPIYGDGTQTRSFMYVDDLVEGIVRLAAQDGARGAVVNLGNPEEITILRLAQTVAELTATPLRFVNLALPPDDPGRRRPDIARARALLQWEPRVPLREGLTRTIAWWRAHRSAAPGAAV